MTDPYEFLGEELRAAAARRSGARSTDGRVRRWLSHRLRASVVAAVIVLGGGAVALAATGVLQGSPVKPEVAPAPTAGNGLPVGHDAIGLLAADPAGGLPWGMRVLHTTRGQTCAQVGRVDGADLGVLGLDSAFSNDGRFHALAESVLPPGYGGSQDHIECTTNGRPVTVEDLNADRSGVRLLPQEFTGAPGSTPTLPAKADLRALGYGLLGPHAVSVTYKTPTGVANVPVTGSDGAFLIVEPAFIPSTDNIGGSTSGEVSARSVSVLSPVRGRSSLILAATFRFGTLECSQGTGAPVHRKCPFHRTVVPILPHPPTRNLHQPVHLTLLAQTRVVCDAAYLRYPCYRGQVEFTAPYAVTSASSDYLIDGVAKCKVGGRPETSWTLEHNVTAHETVRANSLGLFVFTPSCAANESFEVRYLKKAGIESVGQERVVVGKVTLAQARFPDGARVSP